VHPAIRSSHRLPFRAAVNRVFEAGSADSNGLTAGGDVEVTLGSFSGWVDGSGLSYHDENGSPSTESYPLA
jgi:hypothetical protein